MENVLELTPLSIIAPVSLNEAERLRWIIDKRTGPLYQHPVPPLAALYVSPVLTVTANYGILPVLAASTEGP